MTTTNKASHVTDRQTADMVTLPPGCVADGTAPHMRCRTCDYCHEHAPKLAAAAHAELTAVRA